MYIHIAGRRMFELRQGLSVSRKLRWRQFGAGLAYFLGIFAVPAVFQQFCELAISGLLSVQMFP